MDRTANKRELRHDRHTVSLLSDHMVFAPKYRGKILTGDVAMMAEGIICKTCKEMDIEIIEIAVNPDHVHIFFRYPPKYSLRYREEIKRSFGQAIEKRIFSLKGMVWRPSLGAELLPWKRWEWMGYCREVY